MNVNLGRIGFVNKGNWSDGLHKLNDVITYNSSVYACIAEHTSTAGDILPTNASYWIFWIDNSELALKENITDNDIKLALKENITDNDIKLALKADTSTTDTKTEVNTKVLPKVFNTAGGTANAITVTIPSITSYSTDILFMFKATATNTLATTINVNGLGLKNIVVDNVALVGGEVTDTKEYFLRYSTNGNFELIDLNKSNNSSLFIKPNKGIPLFVKTAPSTIKIPSGFKYAIGSGVFTLSSDYVLEIDTDLDTGTKVAGTDYYVYAKTDSTFYISDDGAISTDRLIGGFHYGLVPEDFTLRNNISADDANSIKGIWARSAWDLNWRPSASTKGMTYNILGFWNDIYLCNGDHIVNGTSKAGANIAGGATTTGRQIPKIPLAYGGDGSATYGKMTWYNACEIAASHGKRLLGVTEFPALAYGVKEASSAGGLDNGIIKHLADYLSPYMEQATGVQSIWSKDIGSAAGTTWEANTDGRGSVYGSPKTAYLGGHSSATTYSGSCLSSWSHVLSNSYWFIGVRLACDHLKLA